jgi:hypothetical protein
MRYNGIATRKEHCLRQTLTIFLPLWLLTGCATKATFDHTPVDEAAFHRDLPTLKQEYSDIARYHRLFAAPDEAPTTESLVALWGQPVTERRWGEYTVCLLINAGFFAS